MDQNQNPNHHDTEDKKKYIGWANAGLGSWSALNYINRRNPKIASYMATTSLAIGAGIWYHTEVRHPEKAKVDVSNSRVGFYEIYNEYLTKALSQPIDFTNPEEVALLQAN